MRSFEILHRTADEISLPPSSDALVMHASFLLAFVSCVFAAAPTVRLGKTTLVGRDVTLLQQDFFGGIPYAEPPLGDLRLKPPVLKTRLSEAIFDAGNFSRFCFQARSSPTAMSEDCLTINVFRPSKISNDVKLPVLFWTYGGGFEAGMSSGFNGSAIVAQSVTRRTPVIFVSFNYRLGALGFPQGAEADRHGALNLALRDQLAALEWVQANIEIFGGDKSKVTVIGESAGAIMTAVQFLNPDFSKVARAAIFESGSAATPIEHKAEAREISWTNFVGGVAECASLAGTNSTFGCLRTANSSSILNGVIASINKATEAFAFDPTLDGPHGFIPDRPSRLFKAGRFAKLPFIAGTNLDEGTGFTPMDPKMDYGDAILRQTIFTDLTPSDVSVQTLNDSIDRILELYPDVPALGSPFNTGNETFGLPQGFKRFAAIIGDISFQSQRRLWQQTAANARVKTFGYLFTQPSPARQPQLGVPHAAELDFVFGHVTNASDVSLSQVMIDYWISFATSLDPNDGKGLQRPLWAQYTPKNQVVMQLNSANTTLIPDDYRAEQIAFINQNPITFLHRKRFL
ncbi:esterase 1 [Marasmius fiardii PR-910]|nr:esterase 1 [Marasmius fiardii PR-910]